jgi:hypothetical protein
LVYAGSISTRVLFMHLPADFTEEYPVILGGPQAVVSELAPSA